MVLNTNVPLLRNPSVSAFVWVFVNQLLNENQIFIGKGHRRKTKEETEKRARHLTLRFLPNPLNKALSKQLPQLFNSLYKL